MTDPKEKERKPPIQTRKPGRLSSGGMFDRVKLPAEPHPIEQILGLNSSPQVPIVDPDQTRTSAVPVPEADQTRTSTRPVPQGYQSEDTPENLITQSPAPAVKASSRAARPRAKVSAAPERDFGRVANSITRDALPAGAFPGSSKKIYDVLYHRSRAAVTPVRSVRATRRELMTWTGIKNIKTINDHIKRLIDARLLIRTKLAGEHEGSIYEVLLPEEIDQYQTRTSTRPEPEGYHGGTRDVPDPNRKTDSDQYQNSVRVGSGNPVDSIDTSDEPKTSFKTSEQKLDDEVFADLVALLKRATEEVTGKGITPADRERWREVGELLIAELKVSAARTAVSSAPAFLAEHLRRRLNRPVAAALRPRQPEPPRPPITPPPPTDEELVEMFVGFLHQGMTIEEVEGQFSASIDGARWPTIRAATLERYERERGQMRPPG